MRLSDWAEVAHIQQLAVGANIPPGLPLALSLMRSLSLSKWSMGCGLAMVRFLGCTDASVQVGTTQLRLFHACVPAYHLLSAQETHECMGPLYVTIPFGVKSKPGPPPTLEGGNLRWARLFTEMSRVIAPAGP